MRGELLGRRGLFKLLTRVIGLPGVYCRRARKAYSCVTIAGGELGTSTCILANPKDYKRSQQAVSTKKMPASLLKPAREQTKRNEACKKTKDHP